MSKKTHDNPVLTQILNDFIQTEVLPKEYIDFAKYWFIPLAEKLALKKHSTNGPILIGINGSQGSGKSTLSSLLTELLNNIHQLHTINISIDDFYLTRADRLKLAEDIHPLLATRGVPGTHDTRLMHNTLSNLLSGYKDVAIPAFNKATDDRYDPKEWASIPSEVDIVIIEGWIMGTPMQQQQDLKIPVNTLETEEDKNATWRNYVNEKIATDYQPIYDMVDFWVMLKAPSFESVFKWRLQQEKKLKIKLEKQNKPIDRIMSINDISRFIQHYQRLTEHSLKTLPLKVDYLFELNDQRNVVNYAENGSSS